MISTRFTSTSKNLTADQINVGYWFAANKLILRRLLVVFLIGINIALLLFVVYGFFNYFIIEKNQRQQQYLFMTEPKLNYEYLFEMGTARAPQINFTKVINTFGKYDFVAEVVNLNTTWYASSFEYYFQAGDFRTQTRQDYLLPGQTKYLISLAQESGINLNNAELMIENIIWQKQADYEKLQEKFFQFEVLEQKYSLLEQGADDSPISSLSFSIKNNSAYNYWDVIAKVLLFRNEQLIDVNEIIFEKFDSGQTIDYQYLIYDRSGTPNKILIVPDIDILEPAVFRGYDWQGQAK